MEWLERHRVYVLSALTLVVGVGLALLWFNRPQSEPLLISTPVPTATLTPEPTPTPTPLRVYVTGAVKQPEVYVLPPGSIVRDALQAAGGATDEADLNRVNLALQLYDQQQVYVPAKGEDAPPVAPPGAQSPAASDPSSKVNINLASVEELDALPGIGPAIAQRIIEYRTAHGPFISVEEIMEVRGIGAATFADLQDLIVVR